MSPVSLYSFGAVDVLRSNFLEHFTKDDRLSLDSGTVDDDDIKLIFEGLCFVASIVPIQIVPMGYQPIFLATSPDRFQAALSLQLSPHLDGGMRVPAIARAYLELAADLANALDVAAVAAHEARTIVDKNYFVASITDYAKGGAFPALGLIAFNPSTDGRSIQTCGLSTFAGQEIIFDGKGLSQTAIMRRLVRLIHNICINGPVLYDQTLPDLDDGNSLVCVPDETEQTVHISIHFGA